MYQFCLGLGLLLGLIVDNSSKSRTDSGSFRIPMAVQFVFPLILLPGLLFVAPESPRWLVMKSRIEDARKALTRLHGEEAVDLIERELVSIQESLEHDSSGEHSSWVSLLKWGPEGRKAYLGFSLQGTVKVHLKHANADRMTAWQQATGINFITGYGIVFFIQVGIKNAFLIQLGLSLVAMPAIWISQFCIERFGRRPILLSSGLLTSTVLLVTGGCGIATNKSKALEQTIVAMVYLFIVVFNLGWGPTVWVITSEISTSKNRGKLMALSTASNWLFNWLVSFTFPYLFDPDGANLGAKIGFIYGALTLAGTIWVFFLLPETSGLTLEQISAQFERHATVKSFKGEYILFCETS